jgi:hypothetical protein
VSDIYGLVRHAEDFGIDAFGCPQCGEETPTLHEGYCEQCCEDRQRELLGHIAQQEHWDRLTDAQRDDAIRRAYL